MEQVQGSEWEGTHAHIVTQAGVDLNPAFTRQGQGVVHARRHEQMVLHQRLTLGG